MSKKNRGSFNHATNSTSKAGANITGRDNRINERVTDEPARGTTSPATSDNAERLSDATDITKSNPYTSVVQGSGISEPHRTTTKARAGIEEIIAEPVEIAFCPVCGHQAGLQNLRGQEVTCPNCRRRIIVR